MPIQINDGSDIAAAQMVIEYDLRELRVNEPRVASLEERVPEGFELHVHASRPGRIVVVLSPPVQRPVPVLFSGPGTLFRLHFVPVADTTAVTLRIRNVVLSDAEARQIQAVAVP